MFADDMQSLKHGLPTDIPLIVSTLADCATDVIAWCVAKRLQLNADKTGDVVRIGRQAQQDPTCQQQHPYRLHRCPTSDRRSRPWSDDRR